MTDFIKLSDYVFKFVADLGIKHVFMIPGGGAMHLVDSLGNNVEIEHISNLHEQACAIAAHAYGHYTNNLGVALVTTGPGGTNTITGVAGAWMDSTPCLIISGQVKRSNMMGNLGLRSLGSQEVDIVSIVKPIVKYAITILDPLTIRYHLEKAVYLARNGRKGPVWIDIPLDVQAAMLDEANLPGFTPALEGYGKDLLEQNQSLKDKVAIVLDLIKQSQRPVILAGYGIQASSAEDAFTKMAESLNIPVLTTWKAIGLLPDAHPLFAGRPGSIGQRGANFTQQNSDLLISIGARLDMDQIGFNYANFARCAKKVIVDIDPAEIKKLEMPIEISICADAGLFINEMLNQTWTMEWIERSAWIQKANCWKRSYPVVLPEYWQEKEFVNMYALASALSDELSDGDLIVPGSSGPCANILMQVWQVKHGQKFIFAPALGAMGFGLPDSIGACLAAGRQRTVCVNGDGGFQLNIQELETVHRLQLPIKYFVLCNDGYGSIMAMQRNHFHGHYVGSEPSSGLTFPNIVKVARAYDLATCEITNNENLPEKVREVVRTPGPIVCAVKVSPLQVQSPRVSSKVMKDGTMVSRPLEDLWPFLNRDEFSGNMLIPVLPECEE